MTEGKTLGKTPEGRILWRGGEALALQKIGDRFTIQLSNFAVGLLSCLAQELATHSIAVKSLKLMPFVQLAELQVEASHLEVAMQIARSNSAIAFASHVYQMEKSSDALLYLTDQITLQFAEEVSADRMGKIAAAMGLQVLKLVPGVVKGFVFQVMPQAQANPLKLTERLLQDPELGLAVWLAEPNIVTAMRSFQRSGHLDERSARENLPIDLEAVWQITQGDRSTVIAIMDEATALSPAEFSNPAELGGGKIVAPFRLRQSLPHLSRLLTPAAKKKVVTKKSRLEIAPKCALMPIEMDGFLDDQSVEEMFEWAAQQGADIISCDWRAADYFPLSLRQRIAIARAATQGRQGKGCVIVFSTGTPAKDTLSEASWLNGFAVHPDVMAIATDIKPIVAEVAALMLSVNPDLTAEEVKQILQETAAAPALGTQSSSSKCGEWDALSALQMAQKQVRRSLVAQWIELQNSQPIEIPDAQVAQAQATQAQATQAQGAVSTIPVEGDRSAPDSVLEIEVSLSLEHSFASDLHIYLTAPNGETVLLQNRSLGRVGSLTKTYSLETTPLLRKLLYQSAKGKWQLQVSDRVPSDTGRLMSWTLRLGV
ncbi:MAG: proprotein convertase P-domain-containing protein [Drouetiella hepatica Uher 2000/2452]|jgi:subtilisin-like proprotein convertase family protein|uniref:Proprotein convertase P-domain-containing protein n=1 Tax=Drouetiella hepatica Uher 2000/2452 TaxID=904376 RepID=A0A951QER3_9CYAN|nr:proprotein convertase P-domain-containing protein [Drouetiella hepatica Uher 2000/2452]